MDTEGQGIKTATLRSPCLSLDIWRAMKQMLRNARTPSKRYVGKSREQKVISANQTGVQLTKVSKFAEV